MVDSRWIWPSTDIKNMYKANINNFFKIEKRHSKIRFMRKWDDFYRSDKYLDLSNVYRYLRAIINFLEGCDSMLDVIADYESEIKAEYEAEMRANMDWC